MAMASTKTRSQTDIWLIGQVRQQLIQTKLPSIKEVLSLFFHYKVVLKLNNKEAAKCTAVEVMALWEKSSIPTRLQKHVLNKILQYFAEWQNLKKNKENKAKRSQGIKDKEEKWQIKLDELFDIAHANALNMMTVEEDRKFLLSQRQKGRPGKIGSLDKDFVKAQLKKQTKEKRLKRMKEKEVESIKSLTEKCELASSSSSSPNNDEAGTTVVSVPGPSRSVSPRLKRGKKTFMDDNLAASLDIAKLSDRKAAIVMTSTLKSVGHDPLKYNISYSSIRRSRRHRRQKIAESLKSEFRPDVPLTIHWDEKMLEDITGHEVVNRLPILVSGQGVDQLLAVPKLSSGTGEAISTAIHETIISWDVVEKIKCMSFDTTASNTGVRNGACVLLEQKMEKDLLWLACRHHIHEIILEAVVRLSIGPSSGPDILIFTRFKNNWKNIKKDDFKTVNSDSDILKHVDTRISTEMINFAKNQLKLHQPRDDYKELLVLVIIFLGGTIENGVHFRAPAGLHRARWMAKAIYSLKIYLFRNQFKMSRREEMGIKDICVFVVKVYTKYWFLAPVGRAAPRNDLQLLKDLRAYEDINQPISKAAMKKILGHLWYLSEELVALAFFDDDVTIETKRKMVHAISKEGLEYSPKRIVLDSNLILNKNLEDFVSSNTLKFFKITGLSSEFLKKDVEIWNEDEDYMRIKSMIQSMRVVNDISERSVALMEEYNKLQTNDEEQKQYVLLLVKKYRQKIDGSKKSSLLM